MQLQFAAQTSMTDRGDDGLFDTAATGLQRDRQRSTRVRERSSCYREYLNIPEKCQSEFDQESNGSISCHQVLLPPSC